MLRQIDPFQQYLEFSAGFSKPEFYPKSSARRTSLLSSPQFQNLDYGFRTLAIGSWFPDRDSQQWNPFAQRLLIHDLRTPGWSTADDFSKTYTASIAIAEGVHELFHILFWEPFLCGAERVKGLEQFSELSLIFEAYCYWYGEIFTKDAQLLYPDNSSVFGIDSSATSPHFHPMKVFAIEGLKDPKQVLEAYLAGFRGYDSALTQFRSASGKCLRDTVYSFYQSNSTAIVRHYDRLSRIGVFDRFWSDFCQVTTGRNPHLAAFDISKFSFSAILKDPMKVDQIWKLLTRARKSKTANDIAKIKLRRRIQARAYFLLSDLNLVLEKRVLSETTLRPLNQSEVRLLANGIDSLLVSIKLIFDRVVGGEGSRSVERSLSDFDAQTIPLYRRLKKIKIASQHQIYPSAGMPEFNGLLLDQRYKNKELQVGLNHLKAQYLNRPDVTSAGLLALEKMERILKSKMSNDMRNERYIGRHNAFVKRFCALPSIQQNFKDEIFSENNFVYR